MVGSSQKHRTRRLARGAGIAVTATVAAAAATAYIHEQATMQDRGARYSAAIAGITNSAVECQTWFEAVLYPTPAAGWVEHSTTPPTVRLSRDTCDQLSPILTDPAAALTHDSVLSATVTLTHEAVHTTGIDDETDTQCGAEQATAAVAESFGLSHANAAAAMVHYRAKIHPTLPPRYRERVCTK